MDIAEEEGLLGPEMGGEEEMIPEDGAPLEGGPPEEPLPEDDSALLAEPGHRDDDMWVRVEKPVPPGK